MAESAASARPGSVWPRVEGSPGPARHPRRWAVVRHVIGLFGLLTAVAAVAVQRQKGDDSILIAAGLSDQALVPLLIAGATFALSLWVVMTAWRASPPSAWARVVTRSVGATVMVAGTLVGLLCLIVFALTASNTQYHRFDIPGSDDDLLVSVSGGLGDSSVRLHLGGPFVYTTIEGLAGGLTTDVVGSNGDIHLQQEGGELFVVITTSDGEQERLAVPSFDRQPAEN